MLEDAGVKYQQVLQYLGFGEDGGEGRSEGEG
jgi:hypothetical protein